MQTIAPSSILFSMWTQEIPQPWGRLLFGAEAAVQALLALSGFLHYSTRKVFSYSQHPFVITILLRSLIIMHHFIRVVNIFNPNYDIKIPVALGAASVVLAAWGPVRIQRLFATLVLVHLIMAIRMWNLWAALYSANVFMVALSKGGYPGSLAEIMNIGIWYGMKETAFK